MRQQPSFGAVGVDRQVARRASEFAGLIAAEEDHMIHMILHAIFGLIIGLLARAILPGGQRMGLILTMILGLIGAWLGGLIGRMTGMYREGHPAGFFMALIGALIVLYVYSLAVARP